MRSVLGIGTHRNQYEKMVLEHLKFLIRKQMLKQPSTKTQICLNRYHPALFVV